MTCNSFLPAGLAKIQKCNNILYKQGHEEQALSNFAGRYAKGYLPYEGQPAILTKFTTAFTLDPVVPLLRIHPLGIHVTGTNHTCTRFFIATLSKTSKD